MFCTPCFAVFPTPFSQLDLNPTNVEATVEAEWILVFLLLRLRHFFNDVTIASSLRIVVQVLMEHFTIFQSHGLSGWLVPKSMKSCLNLSKLRPKYCRFLFRTRCTMWSPTSVFVSCTYPYFWPYPTHVSGATDRRGSWPRRAGDQVGVWPGAGDREGHLTWHLRINVLPLFQFSLPWSVCRGVGEIYILAVYDCTSAV